MAIPHYTYLVLKMPSRAGVLALQANLSITYAYVVSKMPLPVGVLALWANLSITYAYETESLLRRSH